MDRLSEMQIFITVVDQGGFTDAAKQLGLSKSAVSKNVSALESRLSARLLNRTTRRVKPTEIGLAYYGKAKRVLSGANYADAMVTSMQSEPSGMLRISAPLSFGIKHLSPVISQFLFKYPDVDIDMNVDDSPVDILGGGFDVGIRIGRLTDSSLRARKLTQSGKVLVASAEYLKREGVPQSIDDLNNHSLLHYSFLLTANIWRLISETGEERQVRVGGRLTVNNGETLMAASEAGLGISQIPEFTVCDSIRAGRLIPVLDHLPRPQIDIHAIYPEGKYIQPKLRAFIDFIAAHFRNLERW